jgi:hypothetical protein
VEKFELSDFSGGQQERFSAADFKPNEWARLKGFVVEDARTLRSQWAIHEVGHWMDLGLSEDDDDRAQSLAALVGPSDVSYLLAFVKDGNSWKLVSKKLSRTYLDSTQAGQATSGSNTTSFIKYQRLWDGKNYTSPLADGYSEDLVYSDWQYVTYNGSTITYTAPIFGLTDKQAPRFICNLPYSDSTGTATNAVLISGTPANTSSTISYIVYITSSGTIGVNQYTNVLPSATSDTDANFDGVLDNGGALVVSSGVMPKANVGVWWRGQLILGDVEYFANPVEVEKAHSEAYDLYVGAYKDWLAAKDSYNSSNPVVNKTTTTKSVSSLVATVTVNTVTNLSIGDTVYITNLGTGYDGYRVLTGVNSGSNTITFATTAGNQGSTADVDGTVTKVYPILPPTAIATIQPNRGTDYIALYKTYILAWKAKFLENKATSSANGFPSAPSPTTTGTLKRYRNGIWFSQPGTVDQFHPFAFTADVCPPDAQIVGFVPVEDGLLVITSSSGKDAVILLRGTSLGYIADDQAVINVRVETVKGAIGSKSVDSILTPSRASYWSKNAAAVYLGQDGGVYATNGNQTARLDNFKSVEPIQFEQASSASYDYTEPFSMTVAGSLPAYDQVYSYKDYIFLSRGFRWYVMKQLEDGAYAWSELVYPFPLSSSPTQYERAIRIAPRHMVDVGNRLYFIASNSRVYSLVMSETESDLSSSRGSIRSNNHTRIAVTHASAGNDDEYPLQYGSWLTLSTSYPVSNIPGGTVVYISGVGEPFDGYRVVAPLKDTANNRIRTDSYGLGVNYNIPLFSCSGTVNIYTQTVIYPDLTVSTATLQGDDNYAKSFWHRVGVRVKQVYNSTTGTLKSIVVRDTPALAQSSNSTTATLNTTVVERGELVAPAQGPSVEFSADLVFTGDVMVEGVTVYKHGKVPRRK